MNITHYNKQTAIISQSLASPHPKYRKKRNLLQKGSNHQNTRQLKNGTKGNEVYLSWNEAAPCCWDHLSQYFYKGTICEGFEMYEAAWD